MNISWVRFLSTEHARILMFYKVAKGKEGFTLLVLYK